jgi:hypothetical protein
MIRVVCMLLVGWAFLPLRAQVPDTIIAWQPQWYVLEGGRLVQNPDWQREHTGFFEVPTFQQTHLFVSSRGPFTVWINQVFLGDYVDGLSLSLDSLRSLAGTNLWIGLRPRAGLSGVQLALRMPKQLVREPFLQPRPRLELSNFIVLVALFLLGYAIIVWRISPRLFFEYFNVARIVSTRERDETQLLRITSSQNILYYFFLGGWLSFLVVMLIASDPSASLQLLLGTQAFRDLMVNWVVLMLLIVILLFAKYGLQLIFSGVYAVFDQAADQFFTFVRLGFVVALVVSAWMFGSYLLDVSLTAPYPKAVVVLLVFSLISIPFMQIRIMKSTAFRMFHIFSYLCITEVIPLIITFRILYY